MKEIASIDEIIVGRVVPHIYAFTTGTVPNYLKVGDTYRPVSERLNEWKNHFPDLEKQYEKTAKVSEEAYFRDYAVHYFLENEKSRIRLKPHDVSNGIYYSREFFRDTTIQDVSDAIDDITKDYSEKGGKYLFYNAENRLTETYTYARTENFEPRPNQYDAIKAFKNAADNGRNNLLMYAVMRFGKSFTSMCCAVEINAKIVVIVSAKADVKEEWKKTVESHTKFTDYAFIDRNDLSNENVISAKIRTGKKVVVFLTLQDLQGEEIKQKHKEVFSNYIDLLIIDETHFGARAEKYGAVLKDLNLADNKTNRKLIYGNKEDDFIEISEAFEQIKVLKAKINLHLSGTPYRILMGSEFTKEDIIAFYRFTDIARDQEAWDKEHILSDDVKEWDNPYYGFPKMIRFAFNPNESTRKRMKELKDTGISFAFSALLKPQSVKKVGDGSHKQFVYEKEILELLEVIDGSKDDDELLGFLDYDKIKSGKMCRHIVMVLPYCASCDAMEALIQKNNFKNLSDYEIVNISGLSVPTKLGNPKKIKEYIHKCELKGKKTLTLTVNRMLTGSTVEEWDTMLFLKDTASPQEYDQAIFRLQNQYIKKYVDRNGDIIKYNMKPQTLLVDFMPGRMFTMQEQKAQIYNVNTDEAGNSKLEERLREELSISPIIVMNKDKMAEIEAADILNIVSEYSKSRGVAEETLEIPVDLSLMDIDVIRKAIERENELGSKAGLSIKAADGDENELDIVSGDGIAENFEVNTTDTSKNKGEEKKIDPIKQFRSYYARILFFAFLTKDRIISLADIISVIDTENNERIANHIGISKIVLTSIQNNINKFILRDLDYKIHNLNKLSHDTAVEPIERATVAVHKFGKLGESEVITPKNICDDMVALVPDDGFVEAIKKGHKVLDIAGKAGEFALAIYERYIKLGYTVEQIKDTIYTIPTSGLTYEFTRMIYEILGLNIANIAEKFNDYELLKVVNTNDKIDYEKICSILIQNKPFNKITVNDIIAKGDKKVNFDIIVGNPPYQKNDGGSKASAFPIYNIFVTVAKKILPIYISTIIPAKWFNGGRGLDEFRSTMLNDYSIKILTDYHNSEDCFPGVDIAGGICYFLRDKNYSGACRVNEYDGTNFKHSNRVLNEHKTFIRSSEAMPILKKVTEKTNIEDYLSSRVSSQKPFGLRTYVTPTKQGDLVLRYNGGKGPYLSDKITANSAWINKWKVIMSYLTYEHAGRSGKDGKRRIFSTMEILNPNEICTETYIVIDVFDTENEARNLLNYLKTKFVRYMVSLVTSTQHIAKANFCYVPIQDFSHSWTDIQLYRKYGLTPDEIAIIESTIKPME